MANENLPDLPSGPDSAPDSRGPATSGSDFVDAVEARSGSTVAAAGGGLSPAGSATSGGAGAGGATVVSRFVSHPLFGLAVMALAIALPFLNSDTYAIRIATDALIFVMLAVGLNVVVGYCGLLDLGFAAFFAIGAYTSGILATTFGWPIWATVPVVVLMAVLGGIIIGGPTLRLRSDYLAIVTLGFGEIIRVTANNLDFTGGPNGIFGIPGFGSFGAMREDITTYWIVVVVVGLAILASARLGRGRLGRAWRFVREDEDAAEAMGIHTYRIKFAAYICGAIFGGLAGVLFAVHQTAVSPPSFNFLWSALILMAVVLGGMGSTPGVVIGALIISLLPELLRGAENWRYFVFGVLLIVVMLFRPQGLWPHKVEEKPSRTEKARAKARTAEVAR